MKTPENAAVTSIRDRERDRLARKLQETLSQFGDRTAIVTPSASVTYNEIDQKANQIARALCVEASLGAVALLLNDPVKAIPAMYGVLRSGRTWVVLEEQYPPERMEFIIDDAGVDTIVYEEATAASVARILRTDLSLASWESFTSFDPGPMETLVGTDRPLTITYTSGSTGNPKGVDRTDTLTRTVVEGDPYLPDDKALFTASLGFAGAIRQVHTPILNGIPLHLFPVREASLLDLVRFIEKHQITSVRMPPSLFRSTMSVVEEDFVFSSVREVTMGGDIITTSDVELFRKHFRDDASMGITFSSTEAGRIAHFTIRRETSIDGPRVPVGTVVPPMKLRLLDDDGKEVATGEPGTIVVSGPAVAKQYWNHDGGSSGRFLGLDADGHTIFRTGDVGMFGDDGLLYFLGRRDDQIKVRGFRVEIAEIELALLSDDRIRNAAVLAQRDSDGDVKLVAFVVAEEGTAVEGIRDSLVAKIPEYMIPGAFHYVDTIPTTPNGKADRKALENLLPPEGNAQVEDSEIDDDSVEGTLRSIWAKTLKTPVGPHDNFFEVGGTSILAAKLMAEIERAMGHDVPLASLIEAPTIAAQAKILRKQSYRDLHKDLLVPFRTEGSQPNFFCVAAGGGEVVGYKTLSDELGSDFPFYALQGPRFGFEGVVLDYEGLSRAFVEAIQSVQPHGPYFVGGYSSGGEYAWEVARQLIARGESVGLVALLDCGGGEEWSLLERARLRLRLLRREPIKMTKAFWVEYRDRFRVFSSVRYLRRRIAAGKPVPKYLQDRRMGVRFAERNVGTEPLDALTVLFQTERRPGVRRTTERFWGPRAAGGFEVVPIPGRHAEIMDPPYVGPVAKLLGEAIRRASSSNSSHSGVASGSGSEAS